MELLFGHCYSINSGILTYLSYGANLGSEGPAQQQIAILSFISSRKICSWKRRAGGSQLVSLTLLKELVILEYDCIIGVWLERNCPLNWCLVRYATLLSFIVVLVHGYL